MFWSIAGAGSIYGALAYLLFVYSALRDKEKEAAGITPQRSLARFAPHLAGRFQ
jgi:hypothetical protein